MRNMLSLLVAMLIFTCGFAQKKPKTSPTKKLAINKADAKYDELTTLSNKIWSYEEIAFQEEQSAEALIAYAEANGFKVEKGVAEIPTAFVAEYGSGKPVIAIMGEFDALPGLSQKTVPYKEPLNSGGAGHGCGHNLFGTASLGAATIIKELIDEGKLNGTIRFYGTPAEEKFFGKLWMVRAGLFDDVDVMMDWHPSAETKANVQSSLALVDFMVEFYGQAAHASGDPWNGRSASDALELYTTGINYYREHIKPTVRIHYHIQDGGQVVNVVPDYSRIWTRVRDTKREGMEVVWKQVERIAEGASIMANVDYKIKLISGVHEVLPNRVGGKALQANLEYLGEIQYTEEETAFGKRIQKETGKPEVGMDTKISPLEETLEHPMGGSTDVGDVSWVVPTVRLGATVAPKDTPWHSWAVVACGGMSIGHKGMVYATKALSMTMIDLYQNEKLRNEIKAEFKERKGDYQYKGILPDGPPPLDGVKFD
ncbi:amidohydrolase [Fulvivirga sp. RKSG066]|uniref:amidohydrolase n=1 Tax=Fulvivirga aurantia TaxID=2529383 RepID=UPI0012BCDFEA|nr:amidohydrolase [Fulvivirga aurantia]MTI19950.1 amidohydrolase [Fulvivirga aurantia]